MSVRGAIMGWLYDRLYFELALAYDPISWLVSGGRWRAWQREAARYVIGPRVLEIGTGPGHLLGDILNSTFDAYGIDRSPGMARTTVNRLRRRLLPTHFVEADARALPFPSTTFDSVILTFPAPYARDRRFQREACRVLRQDGRLIILWAASSGRPAWLSPFEAAWRLIAPISPEGAQPRSATSTVGTLASPAAIKTPSGDLWLTVLSKEDLTRALAEP